MPGLDHRLAEAEAAGRPIRVGMIGAGATARMIARHLATPVGGVRLCAIANRTIQNAERLCREEGFGNARRGDDSSTIDGVIAAGGLAISTNPLDVCAASHIDVIVEVTGTIEFGARVALAGIEHGKHCVLVNAELDATLGPILKTYADRRGVVFTDTDGDEPGVAMTLLRYLAGLGLKPVGAGNLKGMIDRYRTPDTQRDFARQHGMDPCKVTSFADGTKLSMESAILANASGFRVGMRGMYGPHCTHVREIAGRLPAEQLLDGGLVDYALGAEPHTGAFVIVHDSSERKRKDYEYFKMGEGPFYVFYTPFHLPQLQVVSTIARAYFENDATVSPVGGPVCEVATLAKRDLGPGETLDGLGGFMVYGAIENAPRFHSEGLLPVGLAEGCRVLKQIPKDAPLRLCDVSLPADRVSDQLWHEQNSRFFGVGT